MFNSIASLIISSLLLTACNNSGKTENSEVKKDSPVVSTDTVPVTKPAATADEHGCKTDEGEIWSVVRNSCVRVKETGIKMDPQEAMDKVNPAWLIFTDDKVRVEIILPTQKKPVIIRKSSAPGEPDKWANGPLTLAEVSGIYTLDDEGKVLYRSAGPR